MENKGRNGVAKLAKVMDGMATGFNTFQKWRAYIGLTGAAATTAVSIVILATGSENVFLGIFMGIAAYIISGGFPAALKTVLAVTRITYCAVPILFVGAGLALAAGFVTLVAVLMFPLVFVLIKFFGGK